MERKLSGKHKSTPLSGKTQPKLENKSKYLPSQTQQYSDNLPLPTKTKQLESKSSKEHEYVPQQNP